MPKPSGTYFRIAGKVKIGHDARRNKEFVHVARQADIDSALQRLNLKKLKAVHARLASFVTATGNKDASDARWLDVCADALDLVDDLMDKFQLEDFEHLYGVQIDPILIREGSKLHDLRCEVQDLRGNLSLTSADSLTTLKGMKEDGSALLLAIALCKFMAVLMLLLDRSHKKH